MDQTQISPFAIVDLRNVILWYINDALSYRSACLVCRRWNIFLKSILKAIMHRFVIRISHDGSHKYGIRKYGILPCGIKHGTEAIFSKYDGYIEELRTYNRGSIHGTEYIFSSVYHGPPGGTLKIKYQREYHNGQLHGYALGYHRDKVFQLQTYYRGKLHGMSAVFLDNPGIVREYKRNREISVRNISADEFDAIISLYDTHTWRQYCNVQYDTCNL